MRTVVDREQRRDDEQNQQGRKPEPEGGRGRHRDQELGLHGFLEQERRQAGERVAMKDTGMPQATQKATRPLKNRKRIATTRTRPPPRC